MADVPFVSTAFCGVQDVYHALGRTLGGENNNTLIAYINYFSLKAEGPKLSNRSFLKGSHTEYFNGRSEINLNCAIKRFLVSAPPISTTTAPSLWDDPDRVYGNDTKLTENEDYYINHSAGIVKSIHDTWTFNPEIRNLKFTYDGGLVLYDKSTDSHDVPYDLRMACALQVGHWFNTRREPGAEMISIPGAGSIKVFQPTRLLPDVLETLMSYRREIY